MTERFNGCPNGDCRFNLMERLSERIDSVLLGWPNDAEAGAGFWYYDGKWRICCFKKEEGRYRISHDFIFTHCPHCGFKLTPPWV